MTTHTRGSMPGTERSFGLSVGAVLCVIAAALLWRGTPDPRRNRRRHRRVADAAAALRRRRC